MQALIDPTTSVKYVSSWKQNPNPVGQAYIPVYTTIANSNRVCEVTQNPFEIAPPLFWIDCPNDVVADQWYYDNQTSQFVAVPTPAPYPN